jgi:CrcB protein
MRALYVALGAGFGGPARFFIDTYLRKYSNRPYGTFFVNIVGSFLIGLTFHSTGHWHDLVAIGFAGAFTTWSTFMLDIYLAWKLKDYKEAILNLLISLVLGLAAAWLGLYLTK